MTRSQIIAWGRVVDGRGSLADVERRWAQLGEQGARLVELTIDPLHAGWDTPVEANHFRSGCAPVEAIAHADELVRAGQADAVLITGRDDIRSRYADDKARRQQLMAIYDDCPLPEAYTLLARAFMRRHGISEARFKQLAEALYANYRHTAQRLGSYKPPRPQAFDMATDLFRGVDCANPVVDFAGSLIVAGEAWGADDSASVAVLGTGLAQTPDGPAHVEEIACYDHLAKAWRDACAQAEVDLTRAFLNHEAMLEAYTCFPVVPLALLLITGIAANADEIEQVLSTHELTITGGMNIARAAWNNPALNAAIMMCEQLQANAPAPAPAPGARTGTARAVGTSAVTPQPRLGAIHGNGGLGYRQGIAILAATS